MGQNRMGNKGGQPSGWIQRFAPAIPDAGEILDLACGGGRHGRLFLAAGRATVFVDRNLEDVADLRPHPLAELVQADLEDGSPWPLGARRFAGVVVTNYLWRPLFPHLIAATQPGGLLLYETFLVGQERFGRPTNTEFMLRPNELFDVLKADFDILAFEQGEDPEPKPGMRQRIAARRR